MLSESELARIRIGDVYIVPLLSRKSDSLLLWVLYVSESPVRGPDGTWRVACDVKTRPGDMSSTVGRGFPVDCDKLLSGGLAVGEVE